MHVCTVVSSSTNTQWFITIVVHATISALYSVDASINALGSQYMHHHSFVVLTVRALPMILYTPSARTSDDTPYYQYMSVITTLLSHYSN